MLAQTKTLSSLINYLVHKQTSVARFYFAVTPNMLLRCFYVFRQMHQAGVDSILQYMAGSSTEQEWCLHVAEIICLILKEQARCYKTVLQCELIFLHIPIDFLLGTQIRCLQAL